MIIDFHTHVLPAMDDGSRSVEESLQMLRMEAEQGIFHVVATPHFYPQYDNPEQFLRKRTAAEMQLREAMAKETGMPELTVGAEVYFFPGISESDALSQLTIGENGYILLEMPKSPWKDSMYKEVEYIYTRQGITPVIAHVDRYISPFRTYGIPERLAELPCYVQGNASFFLHASTRGMAMRMLRKQQIHLLGSDCHNVAGRPPRLGDAVAKIQRCLGDAALDQIAAYQNNLL